MPARTIALLLVLAVTGCRAGDEADQATSNAPRNVIEDDKPPALPTVAAPMVRRDLVMAAMEAANAHVAGTDDREQQQALDGRQFSFRVRFCDGGANSGPFRSSFDETSRIRRIMVEPDIDASLPILRSLGGPPPLAVEGFWVPRPWLLQATCPAAPAQPAPGVGEQPPVEVAATDLAPLTPAVLPLPTLGLAEFFGTGAPRSARRGERPYSVTRRLEADQAPGPVDLLLEGRLQKGPGGKVIACAGSGTSSPPTCIISVRMDQVSLLEPDGTALARWGSS